MADNLRVSRFNDGTSIPLVFDNTTWQTSSSSDNPAYCWNPDANSSYGALYNFYVLDTVSNGGKKRLSNWLACSFR